MRIKLSVPERYIIIQTIPQIGDFETMNIIESLIKILHPSEVEIKKYEIEVKDNKITWGKQAIDLVEIEFTEKQVELIVSQLDGKSKNKQLDFNQYLIYKKFMSNE